MKLISDQSLSDFLCARLKYYSEIEEDNPTQGKYCTGRIYKTLCKSLTEGECHIHFPKTLMSVQLAKKVMGALLIAIRHKHLKVNQVVGTPGGIILFTEKQT